MTAEHVSIYPPKLQAIIELFEPLSEAERRENLVAFADAAAQCTPREGDVFALEDVRRDQECTDTVGIFMQVDAAGHVNFKVSLGPHVQTLTRAMAAILCEGLHGVTPQAVLEVPQDFVPKIVGSELVRIRSQTVYYILTRMKGSCKVYLDRLRARNVED